MPPADRNHLYHRDGAGDAFRRASVS
jgi:hypothetical protein